MFSSQKPISSYSARSAPGRRFGCFYLPTFSPRKVCFCSNGQSLFFSRLRRFTILFVTSFLFVILDAGTSATHVLYIQAISSPGLYPSVLSSFVDAHTQPDFVIRWVHILFIKKPVHLYSSEVYQVVYHWLLQQLLRVCVCLFRSCSATHASQLQIDLPLNFSLPI